METIEEAIRKLAKCEGLTIEEAEQTYAQRKNLPSSAFCGPNRSYLANSKENICKSFALLSQFGHRLKPAVLASILAGLKRKAKRFSVEHEETIQLSMKILETPEDQVKAIIERFIKNEGLSD